MVTNQHPIKAFDQHGPDGASHFPDFETGMDYTFVDLLLTALNIWEKHLVAWQYHHYDLDQRREMWMEGLRLTSKPSGTLQCTT